MSTQEQGEVEPDDEHNPVVGGPPVLDDDVGPPVPDDDDPADEAGEPASDARERSGREISGEQIAAIADPSYVRRAPRYGRFAIAGVLLGALVALALAVFGTSSAQLDTWGMFLVLAAVLAPLGALIACLFAVLGERRRPARDDRRAHRKPHRGPHR